MPHKVYSHDSTSFARHSILWMACCKVLLTDLQTGTAGKPTDFQRHTVHIKHIFESVARGGKLHADSVLIRHQSSLTHDKNCTFYYALEGWRNHPKKIVLAINTHVFGCQTKADNLKIVHTGASTLHR